MELRAAQAAFELVQRTVEFGGTLRRGSAAGDRGRGLVGPGGPGRALAPQDGVQPGLDQVRLAQLGDVAVGDHEGAVQRVHRGVVIAQRPQGVGVQPVGVGVVGGGPAPAVGALAAGAGVRALGAGPVSTVSIHTVDAR